MWSVWLIVHSQNRSMSIPVTGGLCVHWLLTLTSFSAHLKTSWQCSTVSKVLPRLYYMYILLFWKIKSNSWWKACNIPCINLFAIIFERPDLNHYWWIQTLTTPIGLYDRLFWATARWFCSYLFPEVYIPNLPHSFTLNKVKRSKWKFCVWDFFLNTVWSVLVSSPISEGNYQVSLTLNM